MHQIASMGTTSMRAPSHAYSDVDFFYFSKTNSVESLSARHESLSLTVSLSLCLSVSLCLHGLRPSKKKIEATASHASDADTSGRALYVVGEGRGTALRGHLEERRTAGNSQSRVFPAVHGSTREDFIGK